MARGARGVLVSPTAEVPVIEGEVVTSDSRRWPLEAWEAGDCPRDRGVAQYGEAVSPPVGRWRQMRPGKARRLTDDGGQRRSCTPGRLAGNAVVVRRLARRAGHHRQRADNRTRRDRGPGGRRAPQLATVRVESPPGEQLQIDFGQKRVQIGGSGCAMFLLVAVLSYSRRLFVKAFLNERQDDWREGIAGGVHDSAACRARCSVTMRGPW